MKNKYYIPIITEFRVGFRFEACYQAGKYDFNDMTNNIDGINFPKFIPSEINKSWHVISILENDKDSLFWNYPLNKIQELINKTLIRVKILDLDDIKELNWVSSNKKKDLLYYNNNVNIQLYFDDKVLTPDKIRISISANNVILFNGYARNINELQDIMNYLNLNEYDS